MLTKTTFKTVLVVFITSINFSIQIKLFAEIPSNTKFVEVNLWDRVNTISTFQNCCKI